MLMRTQELGQQKLVTATSEDDTGKCILLINCHVAPTLLLQEVIEGHHQESSQVLATPLACPVNARYLSSHRFTCVEEKSNLFLRILHDFPSHHNAISPIDQDYHVILTSIQTEPDGHSTQLYPVSGPVDAEFTTIYYSSPLTTGTILGALQFFQYEWRANIDQDVETVFSGFGENFCQVKKILKQRVPVKSAMEVLQAIASEIIKTHSAAGKKTMTHNQVHENDPGTINAMHSVSLRNFVLDSLKVFDETTRQAILNHEEVSCRLSERHLLDDYSELEYLFSLYISHMKAIIPDDNGLDSLKTFIRKYLSRQRIFHWLQSHKNEKLWGVDELEDQLNNIGENALEQSKYLRRFIHWNLAKFTRIVGHFCDGNHRITGLATLLSGIDLTTKYSGDVREKVDQYFQECPHKQLRLSTFFYFPPTSLTFDLCASWRKKSSKIQKCEEDSVVHGPREWYRALQSTLTNIIRSSDLDQAIGFPFFEPSLEFLLKNDSRNIGPLERAEKAIKSFGNRCRNDEDDEGKDELEKLENQLRGLCTGDGSFDTRIAAKVYSQLWIFHLLSFIREAFAQMCFLQLAEDSTSSSKARENAFQEVDEFRNMFRLEWKSEDGSEDKENILFPFVLGGSYDNALNYYQKDLDLSNLKSRHFREKLPFLDVDVALAQLLVLSFWSANTHSMIGKHLELSDPKVQQRSIRSNSSTSLPERWICLLLMSVSASVHHMTSVHNRDNNNNNNNNTEVVLRFQHSISVLEHSLSLFSHLGEDPYEDDGFNKLKGDINSEENKDKLIEVVLERFRKLPLDREKVADFIKNSYRGPITNELEFLVLWHSFNMREERSTKELRGKIPTSIWDFYKCESYNTLTYRNNGPPDVQAHSTVNQLFGYRIGRYMKSKPQYHVSKVSNQKDEREPRKSRTTDSGGDTGGKRKTGEKGDGEDADKRKTRQSSDKGGKRKTGEKGDGEDADNRKTRQSSDKEKQRKRKIPEPRDKDCLVVQRKFAERAIGIINDVTQFANAREVSYLREFVQEMSTLNACLSHFRGQPRMMEPHEKAHEDDDQDSSGDDAGKALEEESEKALDDDDQDSGLEEESHKSSVEDGTEEGEGEDESDENEDESEEVDN